MTTDATRPRQRYSGAGRSLLLRLGDVVPVHPSGAAVRASRGEES
ncbi:hypothetical protein AB0J40_46260 [Amycolatopsis sp. NPDC049691]